MKNEVTIRCAPFEPCRTTVRISPVEGVDGTLILCVVTGAMNLQTYATRDELRALGEMLIQHADAGEVLEVGALQA